MQEEVKREKKQGAQEEAYNLLSRADEGEQMTVRDDQVDFYWLLDSVKLCRRRGSRFRLIDSGKLDLQQIECLVKKGADLYTSDEARPEAFELEILSRASREGGAFVAFFHHGSLESAQEEVEPASFSFQELMNVGRSGVFLHLSNKEEKRDFSKLDDLAYSCHEGGSWLVYYHHGPLEASLEELGGNGAWIHLSDRSIREREDGALVLDTVKSARAAGANLILYLDVGLELSLLRDVVNAGAFLQFDLTHFARRSPLQTVLKRIRKKRLDSRAYYIYPHFMP